jgi:hypothetical protein
LAKFEDLEIRRKKQPKAGTSNTQPPKNTSTREWDTLPGTGQTTSKPNPGQNMEGKIKLNNAIAKAETWISHQNVPELEQKAYAVLANPLTYYSIAFKFSTSISAFNKDLCKIVIVQMDDGEISTPQFLDKGKDQQLSHDMIPISPLEVNASKNIPTSSAAPTLGSYLVLDRTNPTPTATATTATLDDIDEQVEEQWMGKWYDEAHERYIVRTQDGAYRDLPLNTSNAAAAASTGFRVRTPPVLVSPTSGREPSELDVKTSHPTQRFLLIQRAPDIITIYLTGDTSKHWDIKVRSKRGGNLILASFFTLSENDIVLISSNGIEIYSFFRNKKTMEKNIDT